MAMERLQRALKKAVAHGEHLQARFDTYVAPQLRHALFQSRTNIRTVQKLLGHSYVSTTMLYTHVLKPLPEEPPAHWTRWPCISSLTERRLWSF